jgi:putative ubiquitin-RnfH superfamily antitoxin RatB of RatAB toxin-antitoxin module
VTAKTGPPEAEPPEAEPLVAEPLVAEPLVAEPLVADPVALIVVEIVHAEAQRAVVKSLSLPQGASLAHAMLLAAQDADLRGLDLSRAPLGIFGQLARRDQVLHDGDRIEIYRPLSEDPKIARRKRAGRPRPG